MRFIVKEISPSRKELRVTLSSIGSNDVNYYIFGTVNGNFDDGTMGPKYIPTEDANYFSPGPQPAIIRLIVGYLKDLLNGSTDDYVIVSKTNQMIPIINIEVEDIDLIGLSSDTIPSVVIKLLNPLPTSISALDLISIEEQIINSYEQDVYYIPETPPTPELRGLDYDRGMLDEVGNPDSINVKFETYNELTGSFSDASVFNNIISGSPDVNLKIKYNNFENFTYFGSAVSKLENFKEKVGRIEGHLNKISQSLYSTASAQSTAVNNSRRTFFEKIQKEKNEFTPYENYLYYNSHKGGFKYNLTIGDNYIANTPVRGKNLKRLPGYDGFDMVYKVSGSNSDKAIELFRGKYEVENKPFYNDSGSFYLSFLMKGDESINNNIVWTNNNPNSVPKLPHDTLYTSSILQPSITSGSWQRYIYHASMSYFVPVESQPIVGGPGGIHNFNAGSDRINVLHGNKVSGSYGIRVGNRYTNLATVVTGSGVFFTGSILPAGELFRIHINTDYGTATTSSFLADMKISKYNPIDYVPFSNIYKTGSAQFENWYDDQYVSASLYDDINLHRLYSNLPEYYTIESHQDNTNLRKFVDMIGEQFDIIKNYIDTYQSFTSLQYPEEESVPTNILPAIAESKNWEFMLPYGGSGSRLVEYLGTELSNINKNADVKNSVWRNILNNLNYIYKTKGTQNSIRALLNSYGFPPDILVLREHGASLVEGTALTDDTSNLLDGVGGTGGNVSYNDKKDKLVSYVIDDSNKRIKAEWARDDVAGEAIEFIFKPVKGTNTQTILNSVGNTDEELWQVVLQPFESDDTKSRLQFRLNTTEDGTSTITSIANRVSMSSDYKNFKNQNFWNVLLQRKASGDFELYTAEQRGDLILHLDKASIDSVDVDAISIDNWTSTGSRNPATGENLIIGGTYTGSMAELRVWKNALSASVFKTHVLDKKSVSGNTVLSSRYNLIYHFKLNENYIPGAKSLVFKDSNPKTLKDYSIPFNADISNSLAFTGSLYDEDQIDRIQFGFRSMGSSPQWDVNNILLDTNVRTINNLNPLKFSKLTIFDPLVNERKASSLVEIVRSPQDTINEFITEKLGNFDINDKFANPQDIYRGEYKDLKDFTRDFMDHYDVSMNVNTYIRAQLAIFDKSLMTSIKRLIPARATLSKIGVHLKPTYLERNKIHNHRIQFFEQRIEGTIQGVTDHKEVVYMHQKTGKDGLQHLDTFKGSPLSKLGIKEIVNIDDSVHFTDSPMKIENILPLDGEVKKVEGLLYKIPTGKEVLHEDDDVAISLPTEFVIPPEGTLYKIPGGTEVLHDDDEAAITFPSEFVIPPEGTLYKIPGGTEVLHDDDEPVITFPSEFATPPKGTLYKIPGGTAVLHDDDEVAISFPSSYEAPKEGTLYKIPGGTKVLHDDDEAAITFPSSFEAPKKGTLYKIPGGTEVLHDDDEAVITFPSSFEAPKKGTLYKIPGGTEVLHDDDEAAITFPSSFEAPKKGILYKIPGGTEVLHDDDDPVITFPSSFEAPKKGVLYKIPGGTEVLHDDDDPVITFPSSFEVPKKGILYTIPGGAEILHDANDAVISFPSSFETSKKGTLFTNDGISIKHGRGDVALKFEEELFRTIDGDFLWGEKNFNTKHVETKRNLEDNWGTGSSNTQFIHWGWSGSLGDYNTYHYEERNIFTTLGDVETLSGSFSHNALGDVIDSFETDYTSSNSKDIKNKTFLTTFKGLGERPLGTTYGFVKASTVPHGGKYLDEELDMIYPANHDFIIGNSKYILDELYYKGTQNEGGQKFESKIFNDLSKDAFYTIVTTGENRLEVNRGGS